MSKELPNDIMMNTLIYGIHHPKHFHSFSSVIHLFIPRPCEVCHSNVYPFVSACVCLRCGTYAHRSCIRRCHACPYFTFKDWDIIRSTDEGLESSNKDLQRVVDKALLVPKVLGNIPIPGSEFCIWRSVLRAVALRTSNLKRCIQEFTDEDSTDFIDSIINNYLLDNSSFPARVCYTCCDILIQLHFGKQEELFSHSRECMDTVVCAILSICQINAGSDLRVLKIICESVDKHVMNIRDGNIYNKLFNRISEESIHQMEKIKSINKNELPFIHDWRLELGDSHSLQLTKERTVTEKLRCLVSLLQLLSTSFGGEQDQDQYNFSCHSDDYQIEVESDQNKSNQIRPSTLLTSTSEEIEKGYTSTDIRATDVEDFDEDQKVSINLIVVDEKDLVDSTGQLTNENSEGNSWVLPLAEAQGQNRSASPVTTDELIQIFCALIVKQTEDKTVNWWGEYHFMSCRFLLRDISGSVVGLGESDDMNNSFDHFLPNGPDGYALATLQQCLHILKESYTIQEKPYDLNK